MSHLEITKTSIKLGFIFLLISLGYHPVSGQHFEWAASASNLDLRYTYASVDMNNNVVVGGLGRRDMHHEDVEIYDGKGDNINTNDYYHHNNTVISYSSEGTMNWTFLFHSGYTELFGITHDKSGNTILLVNIRAAGGGEYGNPIGHLPELFRNEPIPVGYHLIYLNNKGNYIKRHTIFEGKQPDIDISGFQLYPNAGFVLTGYVAPGKLCDALDVKAGESGGDFLLVLDKKGHPNWADVVSYHESASGYFTNMCKAAIAEDGTVYLGGTFKKSGTFGARIEKADSFAVYVASYTPQGKLNWVNHSGRMALFHAIAANNNGVFLGYNLHHSTKAFGKRVDTTGGNRMVITHFNTKGKVEWQNSAATGQSHDLKLDHQNNLYVLGTFGEKSDHWSKSGIIGTDTLKKGGIKVYIARFSEKGDYQWVKEARIMVTTTSDPLHLLMDDCSNMYLAGTLWFTMPVPMYLWDKAFVKAKGYGAAPLISRFKNTIPTQAITQETMPEDTLSQEGPGEAFCVISPGPWKIRNYPNPFKEATNFEYSLSYSDKATLEIFSLNGQHIQTLFTNKQHEAGKYKFQFKKFLPSGTYIAVLKGTETIASCRIIVIK